MLYKIYKREGKKGNKSSIIDDCTDKAVNKNEKPSDIYTRSVAMYKEMVLYRFGQQGCGSQVQRSDNMATTVNSVNTLFSGLNNNASISSSYTASGNFGINLSDYASIKSGSYYKLMKTYYETKSSSSSSGSTSTAKDDANTIARIESAADDMKEAADALLSNGKDSVFKKGDVKNADGTTTYGYDTDAIYKKISSFVKSYNNLLDQAEESDNTSILSTAASAVKATKANQKLLASVGITIGTDNTLSVDETTFKKSDMTVVSSLFHSTGSYGYQTSAQASMIYYYADLEASKSNTYASSGNYTYNYSTGEIYNTTT